MCCLEVLCMFEYQLINIVKRPDSQNAEVFIRPTTLLPKTTICGHVYSNEDGSAHKFRSWTPVERSVQGRKSRNIQRNYTF